MIRLLYIGESWSGSCARSLREAIARQSSVTLDEINEDSWFTKPKALALRAVCRLTNRAYQREFATHLKRAVEVFNPDAVIAYKGNPLNAQTVDDLKGSGVLTVNVYPDCSPHAHGSEHKRAVGVYDLVLSTKEFHPSLWSTVYGYTNECRFIPQGYDPLLHLYSAPAATQPYDLVLAATYRREYGELIVSISRSLREYGLRAAIAGNGWDAVRSRLPAGWITVGPLHGRSYVEFVRSGKICISPVTRDIEVDGRKQPGDEDTTRTYELAAAFCFFVHRRTRRSVTLYDEKTEVPMFDDADELASVIGRFINDIEARQRMARAAHSRAVPAYSLDSRAEKVVAEIVRALRGRVLRDESAKSN
jgi:hypothetical protein